MKTGFRRFIYGYKPPLEKETMLERRKDELRYPWPNRDNIYRSPRKDKAVVLGRRRDGNVVEEADDHYPQHDPFGLYRPHEKRLKSWSSGPKDWDAEPVRRPLSSSTAAVLARLHAKSKSLFADAGRDDGEYIADYVEQISQPIRRSGPIDIYVPATDGEYQFVGGGVDLDPETARKIRNSRDEIQQFDRLLDATFPHRPRTTSRYAARPSPTTPAYYSRYSKSDPEDDVIDQVNDASS